MVRGTRRGLFSGSIATLLFVVSTTAAQAQSTPASTPVATVSKAAKPAAHAAKPTAKAAAAKRMPPKKIASPAKRPPPAAKVAATRKPIPTVTLALAISAKPATATTAKPPAAGAAPGEAKPAITPVSLVRPGEPVRPLELPALTVAPAAPPANAAGFVSAFLNEAFRIAKLSGATSLQRRAQLAELFANAMDVKRIAGYTTSDELSGKSPDIQQRFRTILVSFLVETYYPQLELASNPGVRVDTAPVEPLGDGTAVVWTTFTKDGWGSQSVKWHLVPEAGSYKIIDIFSAGASLVQMERDTFQSVMRNGGFNTLMAKLDARTRELASAATE
jgi:ABC-type transporter MlaC component